MAGAKLTVRLLPAQCEECSGAALLLEGNGVIFGNPICKTCNIIKPTIQKARKTTRRRMHNERMRRKRKNG